VRVDDQGQLRAVLGIKRRMRSTSTASRLDALFDDDGSARETAGAARARDAAAGLDALLGGGAAPAPARTRRASSRLDALAGIGDPETGAEPEPTPTPEPEPEPKPAPEVELTPGPEPEPNPTPEPAPEGAPGAGWSRILQVEWVRHAVRVMPVIVGIAITLACIAASYGFADLLSLLAIATIMFLGGVLPVLLGLAMRVQAERRGSPGRTRVWALWTLFGAYVIASGLYAVAVYQEVLPRAIAAIAFALSVVCMVAAQRFGAFRPRSTVAIELDPAGPIDTTVLVAGEPRAATAPRAVVDSLQGIVVEVDDPVVSPVLVAARQGDGVPPTLETWQVSVVDVDGTERFLREGAVSDVTGELVEVPEVNAGIRVRWTFR
jgi:hypothetical protein